VGKKKGTIWVCISLCDLNKECSEDTYPTPFILKIIDECFGNEIFSLPSEAQDLRTYMDGFSGYNQIYIHEQDQNKTMFLYPWGTFACPKMSFGLKNARATFQRAISYAFHDMR